MIILGADLSTKTGVAYDEGGAVRLEGFRSATSSENDFGDLFLSFDVWWRALLSRVAPAVVAFESPMRVIGHGKSTMKTSQTTIRILFGLATIAELRAHERGIEVYEVNISTVKRQFAGDGRADKKAMIARARLLGYDPRDDNQADAVAVWQYVKCVKEPSWAPRSTPLFARQ